MKNLTLFLFLGLIHSCLFSQKSAPLVIAPSEKIDKIIPELMEMADIPGLSIAIVHGDEIVYNKAFGLRSADTEEPVTSQTIFSAASLSKALFAYGLMTYVEEGKFDLDKPLYKYFPYEDLEHDDRYKKLTARHVLSHTTGLPNWRRGEKLEFIRDPGVKFGYSGEGFVFLMKVIEHLSGQPINEFMKEHVFQPLGMKRSSYVWQEDFESDHAIPHDQFAITRRVNKPEFGNTAYSLQTTAADYILFIKAMLNQQGLSTGTIDKMLEDQVNVVPGSTDVQWGLGIGLQHTRDGKAFWHWGDNGTFKAFFVAYPKQKIGLVYFANSSNGLSITGELVSACIGGDYPSVRWNDYEGPKAPARQLLNHIIREEGTAVASWPFMDKNGKHQDTTKIAESPMNRLGYNLFNLQRPEAALQVLQMNALAYPHSANAQDSYGEALLRNGHPKAAADAYERAAQLDTSNTTASTIVKQIRKINDTGNTTFILKDYPYARSVQLAGDFNNWNNLSCPMVRENGQWIGRVDLEPGTYHYKFIVDGVWILDPANPKTEYEDGHASVLEKQ
ncbi:MAG: serine hydrolase [Saprospiraceae bacterium]|nr:serine hydrolase [Lewinella sp.]